MENTPLNVEEVGQALQLHPETVKLHLRRRHIKGTKIGRKWLVAKKELARVLAEGLPPINSIL